MSGSYFLYILTDFLGLNRKNIIDNRVHCCFYFINPYGHGLKPLDIEVSAPLIIKIEISILRETFFLLQFKLSLYYILVCIHFYSSVQVMRHLSNKVNIVPVIAKADCLTQAEIGTLKRKILQEIQDNDIKIYSLPECDRYVLLQGVTYR